MPSGHILAGTHSPEPWIVVGFAHHEAIDQRQGVIVEGFEVEAAAMRCAPRPSVAPHGLEEAPCGQRQWRVAGHKDGGFAAGVVEAVADIVQGDHVTGLGMIGATITSTRGWTMEPQLEGTGAGGHGEVAQGRGQGAPAQQRDGFDGGKVLQPRIDQRVAGDGMAIDADDRMSFTWAMPSPSI